MKITHVRPKDQFVILPNATVRDPRLSYQARGVLAELLSRPDGWHTTADDMAMQARRLRGYAGESRRTMRRAFAELEAAGYLHRTRVRGDDGRVATKLEVTNVSAGCSGVPASGAPVISTPVRGTSSQKTETKTGTNLSPRPPEPQPEQAAADEDGDEPSPVVEIPAARGGEQLGQEPPEQRPAPPRAPRVPASPEVARTAAADEAATAWAAARPASLPSPAGRARVRAGAVQLLAAGWAPKDVSAAAVDMARREPRWTDLARHADHWATQQTTATPWTPSAPACGLGGSGDPWAVDAPARPPWCGACEETTRQVETDHDGSPNISRCPACHPMAATEPAF